MAPTLLPAPVEDYLVWLAVEKGRAANTLEAYRRDLQRYVDYLDGRGRMLTAVTTEDVVGFVRHLDQADLAGVLATLYESHQPVLSVECLDSEPKHAEATEET